MSPRSLPLGPGSPMTPTLRLSRRFHRMSKYQFSTEHWPIVVVALGETTTDDEHAAIFRRWEAVFARCERFVGITDTRHVRDVGSAKQRARIAEWTRSVEGVVAQYSLGHAVIINSALVRGALTAIGWIHRSPVPERYVGTVLEAWDYCLGNLRAAGIAVPPSVAAHRAKIAVEEVKVGAA